LPRVFVFPKGKSGFGLTKMNLVEGATQCALSVISNETICRLNPARVEALAGACQLLVRFLTRKKQIHRRLAPSARSSRPVTPTSVFAALYGLSEPERIACRNTNERVSSRPFVFNF